MMTLKRSQIAAARLEKSLLIRLGREVPQEVEDMIRSGEVQEQAEALLREQALQESAYTEVEILEMMAMAARQGNEERFDFWSGELHKLRTERMKEDNDE